MLDPKLSDLAARVSELILGGKLAPARDQIEQELAARRPDDTRFAEVLVLYNRIGLPRVAKLTDSRKRALRQRLKEHPDLAWWEAYFARISRSKFLMGQNQMQWCATFDWLLKPTNMEKVLEGNYDPKGGPRSVRFDENDEAAYRMSGNIG